MELSQIIFTFLTQPVGMDKDEMQYRNGVELNIQANEQMKN